MRVALMQRAECEEDDVVDHVRVRDIVHKSRKGLYGVGSDVVEL